MSDNAAHVIPTTLLFSHINNKRRSKQQPPIEDALLASKLGILIAVKTDKYANFKSDFVELTELQLTELALVITEYFNVDMEDEVNNMVIQPDAMEDMLSNIETNKKPRKRGFFQRMGSWFGRGK